MQKLSRDSLMTLEAYAKASKDFRAQVATSSSEVTSTTSKACGFA